MKTMSLKALTKVLRNGTKALQACGDAIEQVQRVHEQVGDVVAVGAEVQQVLKAGAAKLTAKLDAAKKSGRKPKAEVIRIVDKRTGTER